MNFDANPPDSSEKNDTLAHYGVKGMRWGVRKGSVYAGGRGSGSDELGGDTRRMLDEYDSFGSQIQKELSDGGSDSEDLRLKYGPQSATGNRLTPTQKKLLIGAAAGIAGAGAIYYLKKNGIAEDAITSSTLQKTRNQIERNALGDPYKGLTMHWDKGVDLPAGSIFKRVSTVAETEIRPEGFYAAFDPKDVDRYKAILPTYWRGWGVGSPEAGGFVNNYRAGSAIKAPSGKETLGIFKDLLTNDANFRSSLFISEDAVKDIIAHPMKLKTQFAASSHMWAIPPDTPQGVANRIFFDAIKSRGYNALIDFNDAGNLSDTPIRTIDGSMFDIIGHEPLTLKDMVTASRRVRDALAHSLIWLSETMDQNSWRTLVHAEGVDPDAFIEHYGIKGMRWGVRKDPETGVLAKTSREARKDAQEFARAKMFYGEGAGTRRKLIKASVEGKSSKDGDYKRAFDYHLQKQDMAQHASKAKSERKRKNVATSTARTARGVKNILTKSAAPVTLSAIILTGVGRSFVQNGGMTRLMNSAGATKLSDLKNHRANMRAAQNLFRDMGL